MKPHLSRYWLKADPDDPGTFRAQVQVVCACYHAASGLAMQSVHIVSVDEMTGIQALQRVATIRPMQPGRVERREFEYTRHGTRCLIGDFDVVTGEVIAPTVQVTRTEEDFAGQIQ